MQVNLPLFSNFLRTSFSKTRNILVGHVDFIHQENSKPVLAVSFDSKPKKPKSASLFKKIISFSLLIISILSILLAVLLMVPDFYYRIFPADTQPIISSESGTPLGGDFEQGTQAETNSQDQKKVVLPPQNENLPAGNWVIIPRIGVRTELESGSNTDEALKKGVWMVPSYGQPGDGYDLPIILAAHRFGWEWWWQTDYWKYHSFYNLPDLEPGDLVEIISNKRKWTYEVYAGEQGEKITDYEADLILYTCKFLNSPVRYFRYARLVDLEQDTQ